MIVVADSGPLHYLILLDHSELLRRFYSRVVVPDAVASELSAAGAPPTVRDWILQPPSWVSVVPVALEVVETITDDLDLGERSAIALADNPRRRSPTDRRSRWTRGGQTPESARDGNAWSAPSRGGAGSRKRACIDRTTQDNKFLRG